MTTKEKRMNIWKEMNIEARRPKIWQLLSEADDSVSDPLTPDDVPEDFLDTDWRKALVLTQKAKNGCLFAQGFLLKSTTGKFVEENLQEVANSLTFGSDSELISMQLWIEDDRKIFCDEDVVLQKFNCVREYIATIDRIKIDNMLGEQAIILMSQWKDLKEQLCSVVKSELIRMLN